MGIDEICTALSELKVRHGEEIDRLDNARAAAMAEAAAAKAELEAARAQYANALTEYVELAKRGIVRDSIIRDLYRSLRASGGKA